MAFAAFKSSDPILASSSCFERCLVESLPMRSTDSASQTLSALWLALNLFDRLALVFAGANAWPEAVVMPLDCSLDSRGSDAA